MTLQRQVSFWIGSLIALILVLWVLRGMLLPFVAGMALAYLLDPVVDRMQKVGMSRLFATFLIVGSFVLGFVIVLMLLVPLVANQLFQFISAVPLLVTRLQGLLVQSLQQLITDDNREWLAPLLLERAPDLQRTITESVTQGAGFIAGFLQNLWSGGATVLYVLSLLVVTPVVAFYILIDFDNMIATVDGWIPRRHRETIHKLAQEMDNTIAGFVRGQAGVCLILASYYGIALTFTGVNFGLLIGVSAGLLSFIPYVGSLAGLLTATAIAIVQFGPQWTLIFAVIGIFLVGQIIEGYVLYPNFVGRSVGLHPVWLMFALFAFGSLFGFVGLLLAVPLAAVIGVLTRFALRQYMESPLYTGVVTTPDDAAELADMMGEGGSRSPRPGS